MNCEPITDDRFNIILEVLAAMIELRAKTPQEAAAIVREAKIQPASAT